MKILEYNPVLRPLIRWKRKIRRRRFMASAEQAIHLKKAERLLDESIRVLQSRNDVRARHFLLSRIPLLLRELDEGGFC